MIDKFGKMLLTMVVLLVFQAYLYVSEPPTSDLYFIFITICASFVALIISLLLNKNIMYLINGLSAFIFRKNNGKDLEFHKRSSCASEEMNLENVASREYSALSISLMFFIFVNMVFALIYI